MEADEYEVEMEQAQRELIHWQNYTTDLEKAALELTMCVDIVNKFGRFWDTSKPEERQQLVRRVFQYIIYDLTAKRIVDFHLQPWAERFIVLRANLDMGQNKIATFSNEK